MKVINYKNINQKELKQIFERSGAIYKLVIPTVKTVMNDVQKSGNGALKKYTKQFDKVDIDNLEVSQDEYKMAYDSMTDKFKQAIEESIKNQYTFQSELLNKKSKIVETKPGIKVWREWRPIQKVGLYVPGGRARYPSSIVMVGVPALVGGSSELIICTPPDRAGQVPKATVCAVEILKRVFKEKLQNEFSIRVFKIGGAQAIAAMTYGTESVSKVSKIFGAGNSYVTAAKMLAFGEVDIDMPAGPSEVMIMADDNANPDWIAADLISQCEHGVESAGVLITTSKKFAEQVKLSAYKQANKLSTKDTILKSLNSYGAAIIVKNWNEGVEIVNEYAPEHLEIVTKNYIELKDKIVNAGSVFLGKYSSEPAGDYATGSNHVLPTNGYAKMFEGLSVDAFGKQVEFQELDESGLKSIQSTVDILATEEGLPAHANAVNIRFK